MVGADQWIAGPNRSHVDCLAIDDFRWSPPPTGRKTERVLAASKSLMPLGLWYQRPMGEARAEGWVEIREVSLTPLP